MENSGEQWNSEWEKLIEANIEKMCIDSLNKEVQLHLERYFETRSKLVIRAQGVRELVADGMRVRNMIDRAHYYDAQNFDEDKIAKDLYYLLQRQDAADAQAYQRPYFREAAEAIRSGELSFLVIEALYGADIMILAERIQMAPA